MATLGKIDEYSPDSEDWTQYVERLEFFLIANKVTDEAQQRAILLSVVGPRTYKTLRSLITPAKPADKSFADLVKVLSDHFSPKPSEIIQRAKFYNRTRKPKESVATFLAELRAVAEHCNFGNSLDNMLRDRLVCGINDDSIQKRLLAEGDKLTLTKAVTLAQSYESAVRDATVLLPSGESQQVHTVSPKGQNKDPTGKPCYRCARTGHSPAVCRFRKERCHSCNKVGHIKRACKSGRSQLDKHPPRKVRFVEESKQSAGSTQTTEYGLFAVSTGTPPITVDLTIDSQRVSMELDTGSAVSLVSEETYRQLWSDRELQPSKANLRTYSGEQLAVLGSVDTTVRYEDQQFTLPLLVIKGPGPSLFGRNWLDRIKLNWGAIHKLQGGPLEAILMQHQAVFKEELGTLQGYHAHIQVDPSATPRFCKARRVPYAYRELVDKELDRLVEQGILEPVELADWAAPIVPVLKGDKKSVRICGDFKRTVNQASKVDRYPIPKIEDLFTSLSGGKCFSTLDMSQAYQQLLLDESSKKLVVINTPKGLFQYNRLPFGISSAPGIFQRVMDSILQNIPGVIVYLDDILVTGPTEEAHLKSLKEVLIRLEKAGLRLNKAKCKFMESCVTYLGYCIDSEGLHPTEDKLDAVRKAPEPRNVTELKSYLGLLTYYGRFLPHLPSVLAPLYTLLRKGIPWNWQSPEQTAFQKSKDLLLSSQVLVHYDPTLEIVLACDASCYGIGAVLAHKMPDGSEKPIGFASRTLSSAEKQYSQIEKEGLSCVFGVKRFHDYLIGRHFSLVTDHRPLLALFNEQRAIPSHSSARIQRWALTLAAYEYTLTARRTDAHANADALSRLPLKDSIDSTPVPAELILTMDMLENSPVTSAQIKHWTSKNTLFLKVRQFMQSGWPNHCSQPELKPYWSRRNELSCLDGCILWGTRVIVPPAGRQQLLHELHIGHPGMSRMKALARTIIWWPQIDADIEQMVKSCNECQLTRPAPPVAPLQPLPWPSRPWSRLHIDFAGPFQNHMFLVVIDACSKWIEVFPMNTSTSLATIRHLRTLFSQFGIPDTIVTDNGTCFTSSEFEDFALQNGIKHWKSAPYHPSSNGLAEKAVQIVKQGLKKMKEGTVTERLARLLFSYRITPHTTTGVSPAQLLMGRDLKSRWDLLKPNLAVRVEEKQQQQKKTHDSHARARQFQEGDEVYARDFRPGQTWQRGKVVKCVGPVSYRVEIENGQIIRRHQDHLRKCSAPELILTDDTVESSEHSIPNPVFPRRNPPRQRRLPDRYSN